MSRVSTLQELLTIEDDEELVAFQCADGQLPLWPLVRNQFFRMAMSDEVFSAPLVAARRGVRMRANLGAAIHAVARAALHNATNRDRWTGAVLLTSGAAGLIPRDGRWFNRLTDHFAGVLYSDTVILEDLFRWQWRAPRHHDRILFHTPYFLRSETSGLLRVRSSHMRVAEALIAHARNRARRCVGWEPGDVRSRALARLVARQSAAVLPMRQAYRSLLQRLHAQIVLKEMGCYGRSAAFIAAARDLGLIVAEHQHGLVSSGHDAYNVAPALARSRAYRAALPEYFLTFGSWWGEQISIPVKCVAVGNPHRTESIAGLPPSAANEREILVLGDGINTRAYLALARELGRRLGSDFRVIFRPHPQERESSDVAAASDSIEIDRRQDLYESLATAGAVASEASTGLFEAIGIVARIFALGTARSRFSLPRHPFETASSAGELADKIRGKPSVSSETRIPARFWAPGWRLNYRDFVESQLGSVSRSAA